VSFSLVMGGVTRSVYGWLLILRLIMGGHFIGVRCSVKGCCLFTACKTVLDHETAFIVLA
jgi:hypothetical protein